MSFFKNKILGLFVKTKGKLSKPLYGGLGHVLMLHRILPKEETSNMPFNHGLAVTPEKLEETIKLYQNKGYDFVSLDEMLTRAKSGKSNKPFIAFTIDDGYIDNLENGLPIFEKYNIPFCIYITTCFPNRTATFWWYWLEKYVIENSQIQFTVNGKEYAFNWKDNQELNAIYPQIKNLFKSVPSNGFRDFLKSTLHISEEGLTQKAQELTLSWDQIKKLSNHPLVTIGGHTINHVSLSKLTPDEIKSEVITANEEIEKHIEKKVKHFAYPYGGRNDVNKVVTNTVKEISGLESAVLNLPGNIFTSNTNNWELIPRYPLGETFNSEKLHQQDSGILHFSNNGHKKKVELI